ncbi:MAG: glutaredoxin family protein [Myxococcota bacterium]
MNRRHAIVFAIAVAMVAFLTSRDSQLEGLLGEPFTAEPGHRVVLFTTSWCGYCAKARRFLDANQVPYTEVDIERSEQGRLEYERLGGYGVPMFVIDGRPIFGLDLEAVVGMLGEEPGPGANGD